MNEIPLVSEDPIRPRSTRRRRWKTALAVAIAIVLVGGGLLVSPNPLGPPATLHIWGKDFNSTGQACEGDPIECLLAAAPAAAPPMTMQAVRDAEANYSWPPYFVHLLPGVRGWLFGLTDAGDKPAEGVVVYLQVGSDAYVPYDWAHCCMPDW